MITTLKDKPTDKIYRFGNSSITESEIVRLSIWLSGRIQYNKEEIEHDDIVSICCLAILNVAKYFKEGHGMSLSTWCISMGQKHVWKAISRLQYHSKLNKPCPNIPDSPARSNSYSDERDLAKKLAEKISDRKTLAIFFRRIRGAKWGDAAKRAKLSREGARYRVRKAIADKHPELLERNQG